MILKKILVRRGHAKQSVTFWCRYWSRDRNRDHFGLENGLETSLVTQVSKDIRTSLRKFIKSKFISSLHIGLPQREKIRKEVFERLPQ